MSERLGAAMERERAQAPGVPACSTAPSLLTRDGAATT
jgi:hypothetical protein